MVWNIRADSDENLTEDKEVQTELEASVAPNIPVIVTPSSQYSAKVPEEYNEPSKSEGPLRSLEECIEIRKKVCKFELYKCILFVAIFSHLNLFSFSIQGETSTLTDDEITALVFANHIPAYQIEKEVDNPERGVGIRRMVLAKIANLEKPLTQLPYRNYDYNYVSLCLESCS